jgi:hypothetical protein
LRLATLYVTTVVSSTAVDIFGKYSMACLTILAAAITPAVTNGPLWRGASRVVTPRAPRSGRPVRYSARSVRM